MALAICKQKLRFAIAITATPLRLARRPLKLLCDINTQINMEIDDMYSFDFTRLPRELAVLILSQLELRDLLRMTEARLGRFIWEAFTNLLANRCLVTYAKPCDVPRSCSTP